MMLSKCDAVQEVAALVGFCCEVVDGWLLTVVWPEDHLEADC